MIDEATLYNILDSVTLLTALTYFLLWYERNALKPWQVQLGNITSIAYTIAMIIRVVLLILA